MQPGWALRGVRAASFAGVCVVLALTGHVHMSGMAVPVPAALTAFGAVAGAAWALGARQRGPAAITSAMVAAQAGLHVLFSAAQPAAPPPPGPSPVRELAARLLCGNPAGHHPGPEEAARIVAMSGLAAPEHPHHPHPGAGASAGVAAALHAGHGAASDGMLAAHLAATVLSGLWLARGERIAFSLLRLLGARLAAPLRPRTARALALPPPARPPRPADRPGAPRLRLLLHTVISRGPPAAPAVR
ncbi:hypothetical protein [Streptomyces marincola]|uniref:Integral membrane protein n=1 Tax=Streptomyces marincola TaxID=2878388 RepID=A0A1W7CXM5_9ACTN|nr:hypothetical protein [Streptomyces marincola]ARQ69090.1 hypothetical protein CAG99_09650 [Streptomyces marincola]